MFDISFSEMILIAVVALVVIGPERLPKVARAAGHLLGRMQRYVSDVKSDINREIQLDELKKLRAEIEDSARQAQQSVHGEMEAARQAVAQTAQNVGVATDSAAGTGATPVPAPTPTADNSAAAGRREQPPASG